MKFSAEKNISIGTGKWIVKIEGAEWKKVIVKAEKRAENELSIPGFRKGKVPANLAKKYLTENKILSVAHKIIVNDAYKFAFDQKDKIEPFSQPEISVKKITKEEYILEILFDLKPEINIKKYKNFDNIEKKLIVVSEEEINNSLTEIQNKVAVYQVSDGPVEKGDTVIFDFKGFIKNKPFKGGEAQDYSLEIGSGNFIAGFEEKMIGLNKDNPSEINVTFPNDYFKEELKNQDATFKILIKEIKRKILPEINDELAKDANLPGITNLIELKNYINKKITEQKTIQEQENFMELLVPIISDDSALVIPEKIVKREAAKLYDEFEEKVKQQKITIKEYKKITGLDDKEINTELFKDAKNRIERSLILEYVIKNEKFEVSENELEAEYQKMAQNFGVDIKMLRDNNLIPIEKIKEQIIQTKAYNFLYDNNGKIVAEK